MEESTKTMASIKYKDDGFNKADRSSESDFEFISEDEAHEAEGYVFINDNDLEESAYQEGVRDNNV